MSRISSGRFIKNKYLLIPILVVVGFLLFFFMNGKNEQSKPPAKLIAPSTAGVGDQKIEADDVALTGRVVPEVARVGEIVKVTITLTNKSNSQTRFLSINTDLNGENFLFIQSLTGATGLSVDSNKIILKNIVINPGQTQDISFTATAYAEDTHKFISTPSLMAQDGRLISKGEKINYSFTKNSQSLMSNIQTNEEEQ